MMEPSSRPREQEVRINNYESVEQWPELFGRSRYIICIAGIKGHPLEVHVSHDHEERSRRSYRITAMYRGNTFRFEVSSKGEVANVQGMESDGAPIPGNLADSALDAILKVVSKGSLMRLSERDVIDLWRRSPDSEYTERYHRGTRLTMWRAGGTNHLAVTGSSRDLLGLEEIHWVFGDDGALRESWSLIGTQRDSNTEPSESEGAYYVKLLSALLRGKERVSP